MDRKPLFAWAPLAILASAAIAYAIVFWTPFFGARTGYTSYPDTYSFDYSVPDKEVVHDLAKLQPEQFQETVQTLFQELSTLSEAELYMLSAAGDNVCLSPLIDCGGVPGQNVKPFVEKALAHKQSRTAVEIAAGGLNTSHLSLAVAIAAFLVSLCGLVLSLLNYRKDRPTDVAISEHAAER